MFCKRIYDGIFTLNVFGKQVNLKDDIDKFNDFTKPKIWSNG